MSRHKIFIVLWLVSGAQMYASTVAYSQAAAQPTRQRPSSAHGTGAPVSDAARSAKPTPAAPTPRSRTSATALTRGLDELRRNEPSLADVRAAALRAAGLDGRTEQIWVRRARRAGALPQVTVRASQGLGSDRDLSRSTTGSERLDLGSDRDTDVEIKAVWQLDRLLFDDVEIRILQARQRSYRERVQVLTRVTALYYQRRKLQLTSPAATAVHKAAVHQLAVAELTGQLDALTDGYFSRELQRRGQRHGLSAALEK